MDIGLVFRNQPAKSSQGDRRLYKSCDPVIYVAYHRFSAHRGQKTSLLCEKATVVSKEACDIGEFFLAKTARDDISNQATEGSEILRNINVSVVLYTS